MRSAAIAELTEIARSDPRVMLLTADLGFGVVDGFARELPDQFVNFGVAEQAMIGVATGMAEAGLLPYCYTISTFAMLRPFEFIRNGPVAHRLPVRIIGVGAGTDYSHDGLTHFALEDVALARSQPGLTVYSPVTDDDSRALIREGHDRPGTAYFRLSRRGSTGESADVRTHEALPTDVLVLALGLARERAGHLAAAIKAAGLSTRVLCVLCLDDDTADEIARHVGRARVCLTVEDHYERGGLGSVVSETIATRGLAVPLVVDGITSLPMGSVGSAAYLEAKLHRPIDELTDRIVRLAASRHPE